MASFVYRCPECRGRFSWSKDLPEPKFCPLDGCDYRYADRDDDVIYMPALLSEKTKSIDGVAQGVMDGSIQRQQMAAELAGTSVEDMSSLKITNLNDRNDTMVSIPEVNNPVSQFMQQAKVGGFQGSNGIGYSAPISTAPNPKDRNTGLKSMMGMRQHHTEISHGSAMSDRPALELQNPGYRRRV